MSFKLLSQETYKNDNGHDIPASEAEVLAPYKHVFDGFYNWDCAVCGHEHSSRACGWPISGQILVCDKCHKKNLLVRTDFDWMNKHLSKSVELEDLDRQIADRVKRLNEFVYKSNLTQLADALEKFQRATSEFQCALGNHTQSFRKPL